MAQKPLTPISAANEQKSSFVKTITLTSAQAEPVSVGVSELIAYSQQPGFTRLNLTGSKTLDVKETTDQIDCLVREVSSQTASEMVGAGRL